MKIVNEFGEENCHFKPLDSVEIKKIIQRANKRNLMCLGFIHPKADVYFNHIQLKLMKKEIEVLRLEEDLSQKTLDEIDFALNFVKEEPSFLYLKFIPKVD